MKLFEIEITETLQSVEEVKAENFEAAFLDIEAKYKNEEIVLTADEYVNTEITPYLYSKKYSDTIGNNQFQEYILKKAEEMINGMSTEELIRLSFGDIESAINNLKNYAK